MIDELARYHRGVLRCDASVAGLIVSGAFPIDNTQASLSLLVKTLPIRIESRSTFWITVGRREE